VRGSAAVLMEAWTAPASTELIRKHGVTLAIEKRDLPAVQGSILFLSVIFVLVNLLADVLYAKADPRVAYD